MELEPWVAEILRTFPGFEDSNPHTEVLVNIRPVVAAMKEAQDITTHLKPLTSHFEVDI